MKQVVLIGDSIRRGYLPTVRSELEGKAEVWGPEENCGTCWAILENFAKWIEEPKPDLVHINCGLHDMKRDSGPEGCLVPLTQYETNLREIHKRLADTTAKTVVWASITPVNEKNHNANKPFTRLEADLDAYNAAATKIAEESGWVVDDLYKVVMDAGRDKLLNNDGVHYGSDGYEILGKAVASCLAPLLG